MTSNNGGNYPPPGGPPWGAQQGQPPPGYPGYLQQTSPKGKSLWPWIIGIGAVVVILVVVAAVALNAVGSPSDDDRYESHRTVVTYEVTGSAGSMELSYQSADRQEPPATVTLPWSETVTLVGEDAYFDVSARTIDGDTHELRCRVIILGATVVEDRTLGEFVGCGGRVNER